MKLTDLKAVFLKIGWLAAAIVLVVVILSAVNSKEMALSKGLIVKVKPLPDGSLLLHDKDVLSAVNKVYGYPVEGQSMNQIDPKRIEKMLEEEPFILDADVFFDAETRVHIHVVQREPVLRVIDHNGLNYYLDKFGYKMPLSSRHTAHVLAATGNIPSHDPGFLERKRHLLKDIFLLAQMLREDPLLHALIEQIHATNSGELILAPKIGDHKIIFGKFEQPEKKLKKLKVFYREAVPYEGWRKHHTIDLRFEGQIVCKKR
jgi:cell division protein FtsQ